MPLVMHPERLMSWPAYRPLLLVLALVSCRSWWKSSILSRLEAGHRSGVKLAPRENGKLETWSCQFQEIYDVRFWQFVSASLSYEIILYLTFWLQVTLPIISTPSWRTLYIFCLFSPFTLESNYRSRSLGAARSSDWVSRSSVLSRALRMVAGRSEFFHFWTDPLTRSCSKMVQEASSSSILRSLCPNPSLPVCSFWDPSAPTRRNTCRRVCVRVVLWFTTTGAATIVICNGSSNVTVWCFLSCMDTKCPSPSKPDWGRLE